MDENRILHQLIDLIQYKDAYQLQSSGIPPQDMYVLERIHFHKAMQIRDLSRQYDIPPSTLTGILDRLEAKNYIQRVRSEEDRRAVELTVTDGGKVLLRKHIREDELFVHNLLRVFPQEKREQLMVLLEQLLNAVQKEDLFKETQNHKGGA